MRITRGRSDAGFTLVEVLIASSILALVFSGFMFAFLQAMWFQHMADKHYIASVIARNQIEHAKTYVFGSLHTLSEDMEPVDRDGNIDANGTFYRTTCISNTVNPNLREITVQVWYEKKPGVTSGAPVVVSTLIGNLLGN